MKIVNGQEKTENSTISVDTCAVPNTTGSIFYFPISIFTFSVFLFSTFYFLFSPPVAEAGVISKPTNNLGLVGYWSFNEATGTVATDFSGNGNHGIFVNSPLWTTGKYASSLEFDGSTNFVEANGVVGSIDKSYSIWVYMLSTSTVGYRSVFGYANNNNTPWLGLHSGTMSLRFWDLSYRATCATLQTHIWYHVVITSDVTGSSCYVNGELTGTGTRSTSIGEDIQIGFNNGDTYINARLDEFRIYNRALSASEIEALYRSGQATLARSRAIISDGLVGWWTMDGSDINWNTNTIIDRSGNGNTGTLINMSTTTSPVEGRIGQALRFDGVDDGISFGDVIEPAYITISAWVNFAKTSINQRIVSKWGNSNQYLLSTDDSLPDRFTFAVRPSGGNDICDSSAQGAYVVGTWYQVVGTYNGVTCRLYVNAVDVTVLQSDGGSGSIINTTTSLRFGVEGQPDQYYANMSLDDVRIYNRALSAEEIKTLYNGTKPTPIAVTRTPVNLQTGLVGHWTFDGNDINWNTNTVTDKSGNGNTGSIINMSTTTSPVRGKIGQAIHFDGSSGYVSRSSDYGITAYPFSLSGWIKTTSSTTASTQFAFGFNDSDATTIFKSIGMLSGRFMMQLTNTSSTKFIGETFANDGNWHHVVGVFVSDTEKYLYVDGSLDRDVITGSYPFTTFNVFCVGRSCRSTPGDPLLDGSVDDVRIYNRALSADEAKQLYNLGR